MTGSAIEDQNNVHSYAKMLYGEKNLLDTVDKDIKCFAIAVSRDEEETNKYEPFLLRTYNHPLDPIKSQPNAKENGALKRMNEKNYENIQIDRNLEENSRRQHYYSGTSDLKLCQAIAATSAIPGAFARERINVNGKSKLLADGGIFCNCPVAVALNEAQSLWPNRPIGVVLSFGLDPTENDLAQQSIDAFRLNHPGLYYQRLLVPEVYDKFDFVETDKRKIADMQNIVRDFIRSPLVEARLTQLLDILFDGPSRRKRDQGSFFCKIKEDDSDSINNYMDCLSELDDDGDYV